MKEILCPICGCCQTEHVLTISNLPIFDNILCMSSADSIAAVRGTQAMTLCHNCGFLFNSEFEPDKMTYGEEYHAERGFSPYYKKYLHHVVQWLESKVSIPDKTVLEVACGSGEFLQEVLNYHPRKCIGVDPSAKSSFSDRMDIYCSLFDEEFLAAHSKHIDILMNRHMVEHIQNPLAMLRLFADALDYNSFLYLETPRLDWILANRVFYDFPYEHCSFFSDDLMKRMLLAAGFETIEEKHTYDGQYFSIIARKKSEQTPLASVSEEELQRIRSHLEEIERLINSPGKRLALAFLKAGIDYGNENGIYLWGGSAKGVMCCNLLHVPIVACIDSNPFKQGKFIPGTGTPVIAPEKLNIEDAKIILVENDVYMNEIEVQAKQIKPGISVLSINHLLGIGSDPA